MLLRIASTVVLGFVAFAASRYAIRRGYGLLLVPSAIAGVIGMLIAGLEELRIGYFAYEVPGSLDDWVDQSLGFLICSAGLIVPLAILASGLPDRRKPNERSVPGSKCEQCGYPFRGLPEPRCPECGWRAGREGSDRSG